MQGACHQLFAGPRLAGDQYRRMRECEAPNGPKDFLHGRRLTKDLRDQALLLGSTTLVH